MVKKLCQSIKVKYIFFYLSFLTFTIILIGYARVSTFDQNSDLQKKLLKKQGAKKYSPISGTVPQRPGLAKIKEILRKGYTLVVVWRLDRLGCSLKDLIDWMNYLDTEGVALKSIQESIDTTSATGKLVFHVYGALAEFERNLILERTQAGLSAARARLGGRPKTLNDDKKQVMIDLYNERKLTVKKICEVMNISKPTLYSYVRDSLAKPVSKEKK